MNPYNSGDLLEKRIEKLQNKKQNLVQNLKKLSHYRLFSFSAILIYFSIYYFSRSENYYYLAGLFIFFILFFYLILRFKNFKRFEKRISSYIKMLLNEKYRSALNFNELKFHIHQKRIPENIFQKDLDILTINGLFHYLDTTKTFEGEKKFLEYLLCVKQEKASDIIKRQNDVKKIASDKRSTLKYLRIWEESNTENKNIKIKLSTISKKIPLFYSQNKILRNGFKVLFTLTYISLFINFFFDLEIFTSTFFLIQFILFLAFRQKLLRSFKPYHGIYEKSESIKKILIFLAEKKRTLKFPSRQMDDKLKIAQALNILSKIMNRMSIIYSPSAHFMMNILFLWDFWIMDKLFKWQKKNSERMKLWTNELIYFDSIIPFSHFQFHNPENIYPQISDTFNSISGLNISHPLLPKEKRIQNNLEETGLGEIDLITGSNMSGKTTYLRTIGINSVLAFCGSSVCASSFNIPPMIILTSIRNEDSLADGVSFFYAEVKKMALILQKVRQENKCLVLLDELLKGTNSRERLIASKAVLEQLKISNSISFVTTHDIDLTSKVRDIKLHHFNEIIESNVMSFDYKIKEGVVKTSNALKILELEGVNLKFDNIL